MVANVDAPVAGQNIVSLRVGRQVTHSLHEPQVLAAGREQMNDTERARIHAIVRAEFHKHRFDYYAESIPNSNRKNTVPGCPFCRVVLQTVSQFVDHLCEKVEAAFEREFSDPSKTMNRPYHLPVALHKISLSLPS